MIRKKLPWIKCTFCCLFIIARISVFAQEYAYDANGNLSGDGNKQITSIHYNHLNLVDTIVYSDGRKMIYTYTATGQKLKEQSILSNGTSKQKRDYVAHILYRNDSLQEIKHEDGRSVPEQPGNANTTWEYQYHLTDHLGNLRSTLTSKQEEEIATATLETEQISTEQGKFLHYDAARRINSVLFDHTKKGKSNFAQRLNGSANEKYGIAKSISVMPGDTLRLEAYAKYVDPNTNNWSQAFTAMLSQIAAGTAVAGGAADGGRNVTSDNTPFSFAGLNGTSGSTGSGPKAFLNWVVFDRNFVFKKGGFVKLSDAAKENGNNVPHEKLAQELIIHEPGYVYVYVSNEETTPVDVYFDDLSVTQIKGPVIQESEYDPFGLTFNEYSRENSAPNNFLYNGKELQKDFDLNWFDYGARMYDAALGRWHVIDPLAEKYAVWSPYNYVMNNPVNKIDPDGRRPIKIINVNAADRAKIKQVLSSIQSTPEGKAMIDRINKSSRTVTITIVEKAYDGTDASTATPQNWAGALEKGGICDGVVGTGAGTNVAIEISRYSAKEELLPAATHELDHADRMVRGVRPVGKTPVIDRNGNYTSINDTEIHATNTENVVQSRLGRDITREYGEVDLIDSKGKALVPGVKGTYDLPAPQVPRNQWTPFIDVPIPTGPFNGIKPFDVLNN